MRSARRAGRRLLRGRARRVRTSRRRCRRGWRRCGSGRPARQQPATASRASVSRGRRFRGRGPVSSRTRSRNSAPFSARRQASVAISRARRRARSASFALQILSASIGPVHRLLAERAGCADALAEPDDAREGIDDPKAVAARLGDQQAAIVGAEIERGIERPASPPVAAAPRGTPGAGRTSPALSRFSGPESALDPVAGAGLRRFPWKLRLGPRLDGLRSGQRRRPRRVRALPHYALADAGVCADAPPARCGNNTTRVVFVKVGTGAAGRPGLRSCHRPAPMLVTARVKRPPARPFQGLVGDSSTAEQRTLTPLI